MAINPESQYPGKITPSSADYPYGEARNITTPGDGKGTPWEAALVNDLFGFQQAILSAASITPSGTPEKATVSQYFNALKALIGRRFDLIADALGATDLNIGEVVAIDTYTASAGFIRTLYDVVASGTGTADGYEYFDDTIDGSTFQLKLKIPHFVSSNMKGVDDTALPTGTTEAMNYTRDTYVADSGGATDLRNFIIKSQLNGAYGAQQFITKSYQSELRHTAGTVVFGYGIQGFSRLGRLSSTTGDVTTFRGVEWHTANEGSGEIDSAIDFYAQEVDLLDGTGNINTMIGFLCGNQGHATRVPDEALGYDCADFTAGATVTAAFRSQMTSGTGKYAFLSTASAVSALAGGVRLGDTTQPSDILEVKGYSKISRDGTFTTAGNYHEVNTDQGDYIVHFKNTHGSTPNGIRVRFTGAAPDDNTQEFMRCEDSVGTRLIIYSDGDVVNHDNSYGAISDINKKTDVADAPAVLDKFRQRHFVTYRLKDGDGKLLRGVIAQEEGNVSPELVNQNKDKETGEEYLSFNYSGMAVETAQAVQELLKMVDKQQELVAALTKRVEDLEG